MKKVIILLGIAAVGYFMFGKSSTDDTVQVTPIVNAKIGFNADGTVRQLTDAEAKLYLQFNPDLLEAFGKNLESAKSHWFGTGYTENRPFS